MKLIEALKKIKDLQRQADEYVNQVKKHCAISSMDTPMYPDQKGQIHKWIQAHKDTLQEISRLKLAIQQTNLNTQVTINLNGKDITKSLSEWIIRRQQLVKEELKMWNCITDRGITEGQAKGPTGDPIEIKIIRYYDPGKRDEMRALLSEEPSIIDGKLEIVNAVTDLI